MYDCYFTKTITSTHRWNIYYDYNNDNKYNEFHSNQKLELP